MLNGGVISCTLPEGVRWRQSRAESLYVRSVLRMLPNLSRLSICAPSTEGHRSVRTDARTRSATERERIARDSVFSSPDLIQNILMQLSNNEEGLASILAMLSSTTRTPPNDMTEEEMKDTWRTIGARFFGTEFTISSKSEFQTVASKYLNILEMEYGTEEGFDQHSHPPLSGPLPATWGYLQAVARGSLLSSNNPRVKEAIKYLILIQYWRFGDNKQELGSELNNAELEYDYIVNEATGLGYNYILNEANTTFDVHNWTSGFLWTMHLPSPPFTVSQRQYNDDGVYYARFWVSELEFERWYINNEAALKSEFTQLYNESRMSRLG